MARIWPLRGSSTTTDPAGASNAGPAQPADERVERAAGAGLPQALLEGLLRVLLELEVERQDDVVAGHRVSPTDLADDAVAGVDLVGDLARLASELVLVLLLDAGFAHPLVQLVALRPVLLGRVLRDGAHVAHDVAGQRRVAVHPLPTLAHLHAGVVLPPLAQVDGDGLGDVVGQRERQVRVVLDVGVAGLELLHRDLERAGEPGEQAGHGRPRCGSRRDRW